MKKRYLIGLMSLLLTGCGNNNQSSSSFSSSNNIGQQSTSSNTSTSSSLNDSTSTSSSSSSSSSSTSNSGEENIKLKDKIINVYLIGGQSNAVGYGMDTGNIIANSDKRFVDGFDNVLYYGAQERWSNDSLAQEFTPVKLGLGVDYNRSGAEIGIASAVADNGEMNAIIKCAWGATHLYPDSNFDISFSQGTWTSPSYIKNNNVDTSKNQMIGRMYEWFEETVTNGIKLLKEEGYIPVVKGMWWMQGEAEMSTQEMSSAYEELLKTLISDIRLDISNILGSDYSDMPFVFGLPKWNTNNSPAPAFQNVVREAMSKVARETEVVNADLVDCMPLTQHDDWHFNAAGQKYLGEKFVEKINNLNEGNTSINERIYVDSKIQLMVEEAGMEVKANVINYDIKNNYEYGMIFVPTNSLDINNIKDDYIYNLDKYEIDYIDNKCEVVVEEIGVNYRNVYFKSSIKNIEYKDLNRHYTAIAYIKDNENNYIYSASNVESSISYLASYALYHSTENLDTIKNYVDAGVNYALNVSEENKYQDANLILEVEDELNIKYSQTKNSVNLNLKQNPNVGYFVKYSSQDLSVATVDENGNVVPKNLGTTEIIIECGGKNKKVNVTIEYGSENGVTLDGIVSSNEYVGDVLTKSSDKVSLDMQGMVIDGNTYLSFTFIHGEWAPYNAAWYLNDNIEFKLDDGRSHTIVFYNGEPTFSSNINRGIATTKEVGDKLVTTVELCVEGTSEKYKLKVCMNGTNVGWLSAIWYDDWYSHNVYVTANGIQEKTYLDNGIVLDGNFNEDVYSEEVRTNTLDVNANGATVKVMGTFIEEGALLGVTIDHTTAPTTSLGNGSWYTFMNIEFHFNDDHNKQFIATCLNNTSKNSMSSYCKTIDNGNGYTSTFEIFIPYTELGVDSSITSINFTCSGWVETGWCWYFPSNSSWNSTHVLTKDGITEK